jgi:hypothetical protein
MANVCGTGGWSGPKPGDPDNNVILKATPAFGGIDVSWTYPGTNPHAVAHTNLYRSTTSNFAHAVRHVVVAGNYFYDRTTTATPVEYFYWIEMVSINGTYGSIIGPASATARPMIEDVIANLTGQIDSGILATSLRDKVAQIDLNKLDIDEQLIALAQVDDALGVAYNEVVAHSEGTRALLQEEIVARTTQNDAFVHSVNTLYADVGESMAAIQQEQVVHANQIAANAQQVTTVQSKLGTDIASVQTNLETFAESVEGELENIGALYTAKVDVNGLIGGFGVYNNGTTVEAGFDVDRFWVGRTTNRKKPFIIENNEVFIDQAVINKLTFSKLRSDDGSLIVQNGKVKAAYLEVTDLTSDQYVPGTVGWALKRDGTFENNGAVAGQGRMFQSNRVIKVYDSAGRLRVQLGDLSA